MTLPFEPPVLADIEAALERIRDAVHLTPVMRCGQLDAITGSHSFFKCEQLQKVGAFKARGATNAVRSLDPATAAAGVATHSSGNHGAALALAAATRAIPAFVVMPSNAARVKREAVAAYGAKVIDCEPTLAAREATLAQVLADTGASAVHPFHDPRVIAGQGTVALEILAQLEQAPDVIVVPVGGGGLLAGVATVMQALHPGVEVVAAEPAGADDAFRSFGLGRLIPQNNPKTIADGLRTGLGEVNFAVMQRCVNTVLTVSEESIVQAMRLLWSRAKQVVEPSGAVSFAALLEHPERFAGRRVAVVLSGGNVDLDALPW